MKIKIGEIVQVIVNKGDTCGSGYYKITHIYKTEYPKLIDVELIPPEVAEKCRQIETAFDNAFSALESLVHPAAEPHSYANAGEIPVHITTNLSEEQQDEIGEALLGEAEQENGRWDDVIAEPQENADDATLKAMLVFDEDKEYFGYEVNDACRQAYNLGKLQGEMGQQRKAAQWGDGNKTGDNLGDIQHEGEWILR